jgi:hypothetical protein
MSSLELFAELTKHLEGELYPTLSSAMPSWFVIRNMLNPADAKDAKDGKMARGADRTFNQVIADEFDRRYKASTMSPAEQPAAYLAAVLHPGFKNMQWLPEVHRAAVKDLLIKELSTLVKNREDSKREVCVFLISWLTVFVACVLGCCMGFRCV